MTSIISGDELTRCPETVRFPFATIRTQLCALDQEMVVATHERIH